MKTVIDIETWHRKEHFEWFNSFDEPFWSITADVECTGLYKKAKDNNAPFSLYVQHAILQALNSIEEFRYRIEDDKVVMFDTINISPVVLRDDHTYGCAFMEYYQDVNQFIEEHLKVQQYVKSINGLNINSKGNQRIDTIHYSTHPWITFTGLTRARRFNTPDSCPKISTGKIYERNNRLMMPICTAVHHGFVDGYHVNLLYKEIERLSK